MLTNMLNLGLPQQAWVKKTVYWLSGCKQGLGSGVSKERQIDRLLRHERISHYWSS